MSDELTERNILELILIVRLACATLDVGHPIYEPDPESSFFPVAGTSEVLDNTPAWIPGSISLVAVDDSKSLANSSGGPAAVWARPTVSSRCKRIHSRASPSPKLRRPHSTTPTHTRSETRTPSWR
jgi:hypothetical protein